MSTPSLLLFYPIMFVLLSLFLFFFFNDTATTEIYTLSLHDALPIVFTGPRTISVGLPGTADDFISYLQRAGYSDPEGGSTIGTYKALRSGIEVRPGKDSYFSGGGALRVDFSGATI